MVANAFLIHSLDLICKVSRILGQDTDTSHFVSWSESARKEFQDEYVTANGRIVSDSQTAYALAIRFCLLNPSQRKHAGGRLAYLVRKNEFKIGTGFAGTPYICEALALTGNIQVAYAMLLQEKCPSWLYPVTMGATTVWERWDSMLADGSVNPGEMTSFSSCMNGLLGCNGLSLVGKSPALLQELERNSRVLLLSMSRRLGCCRVHGKRRSMGMDLRG
jgi:alpha-L-rhamnosidase